MVFHFNLAYNCFVKRIFKKAKLFKVSIQFSFKSDLFLYLITNFESRPTRDIDFLINSYSNEHENIEEMIKDIINIATENDYISF